MLNLLMLQLTNEKGQVMKKQRGLLTLDELWQKVQDDEIETILKELEEEGTIIIQTV